MNNYFSKDFIGEGFVFLGTHHLIALSILFAAYIGVFFWHPNEQMKQRFRYALAALLLFNEATWHAWNYFNGIWTFKTMLPLHLCSVLVFLSAVMLITKSKSIYELVYFWGIGGALQAILTPDLGIYGFPHIRFFQVFISHGGIILAALYMTAVEHYRPTWKSFWRALGILAIYATGVWFVNGWLGSNYLYIARKPDTPSLIDLLAPHPWYIIEIAAIAFSTFLILYLPFAIKDWRAQGQTAH